MRAILIVLGIAVLAIVLAILVSPQKDLTDNPADRQYQRQQEDEKREAAKRAAQGGSQTAAPGSAGQAGAADPFNPPRAGVVTAAMTVENRGTVTIEMYPKAAPKTVAQVVRLIRSGFYNGIRFHRVRPGFVAQAGDPLSKKHPASDFADKTDQEVGDLGIGHTGSGTPIPFESNALPNVPGSLAMALTQARSATADSQFFINLARNSFLDGDYCVFGKVVKGMDVVEKIQQGDAITSFVIQ